jgi:hypothetical protein
MKKNFSGSPKKTSSGAKTHCLKPALKHFSEFSTFKIMPKKCAQKICMKRL